MKIVKNTEKVNQSISRVSDKEAEEAFKKIIEWIGENPNREGLIETPRRVLKASSASSSLTLTLPFSLAFSRFLTIFIILFLSYITNFVNANCYFTIFLLI